MRPRIGLDAGPAPCLLSVEGAAGSDIGVLEARSPHAYFLLIDADQDCC